MKTTICLLLSTAAQGAAQLQHAPPPSVGMPAERLDCAAEILSSEVEPGKVGAAAILVARRGRIVLHKGFGVLSPARDSSPVVPNSIFLLASITKLVTASALMLLVDRSLVSLTDPVFHYLPEFAAAPREKVRVSDLLSHTSGCRTCFRKTSNCAAPTPRSASS
ncbi:MAG: class A beta-lactamase-related serine hydrolase [Bryobacterales bacterium]|nr:class A beta-lactamase-related serine hydrolase [Bryobacterales bacterium]